MKSWYLGIDPGKKGAVALICYPDIQIFDWSGVVDTSAKVREWEGAHPIVGAFLEDVHSMPDDGKASAFRFGDNFGTWKGIICTLGIPLKLVSPRQWRKGLYTTGDRRPLKARSLDAARGLFPDVADKYFARKKDHDRAEAALIAYQAERFFDAD